jgi:hypothetical protein
VSKTVLWVVIGIAASVVVALAVLTPTVIANNDDGHGRSVRVAVPAPFPSGRERLPGLRRCFRQHGFGGPNRTLPSPGRLRGALNDCVAPFRR